MKTEFLLSFPVTKESRNNLYEHPMKMFLSCPEMFWKLSEKPH